MPDQGSEGLISPYLRRKRIAKARSFLYGRVLDVGCGNGDLAAFVPPEKYFGVEPDDVSLSLARTSYPKHDFSNSLPEFGNFDVVVALAVIEHISDPSSWFSVLAGKLVSNGIVVLTTPHPATEWIQSLGAKIGFFSSQAQKEHEMLMDADALSNIANKSNFRVQKYERFLWGCNQLFVLSRLSDLK